MDNSGHNISDKQNMVKKKIICVFGAPKEEERYYRTKEIPEETMIENFTKLKHWQLTSHDKQWKSEINRWYLESSEWKLLSTISLRSEKISFRK